MAEHNILLLASIIKRNNEGAIRLKAGHYKKAILLFAKGLKACRQLVSCYSDDDIDSSRIANTSLDTLMALRQTPVLRDDGTAVPVDSQPYVYLHPITIPVSFVSVYSDIIQLLPSILIFNQAIVHHILGLKDVRLLRKAATLYECGLTVVAEENVGASGACYVSACLNNMGLIYSRLKLTEVAQKCFKRLLSTFMILVTTNHGYAQRLNIFIPTVSHLIFQTTLPAAAAA
jgi:tetratricopeptide (TPR) repeat protein